MAHNFSRDGQTIIDTYQISAFDMQSSSKKSGIQLIHWEEEEEEEPRAEEVFLREEAVDRRTVLARDVKSAGMFSVLLGGIWT